MRGYGGECPDCSQAVGQIIGRIVSRIGGPRHQDCLPSITARLVLRRTISSGGFLCTAAVAPRSRPRPPRSLAAAPLLTGCGSDAHPGAAAVVGRPADHRRAAGEPGERGASRSAPWCQTRRSTSRQSPRPARLTRDTLHGMVLDRVLHRAATDAGAEREPQGDAGDAHRPWNSRRAARRPWRRPGCSSTGSRPGDLDESLRTEMEARKLAAATRHRHEHRRTAGRLLEALSAASKSCTST